MSKPAAHVRDRSHPRSLANLPVPPKRKKETEATYGQRVHRWRVFLADEPRPDLWYTPEDEVQEYREWMKNTLRDAAYLRLAT